MDPLTFLSKRYGIDKVFFNDESGESEDLPLVDERFCPNCGTNKVKPDQRKTSNLGELLFNLDDWYCKECSYTGVMPTRDMSSEDDIDFEPVNQEKIDTSAGKGLLRYYLQILIPVLILTYVIVRLFF